MILTIQQLAIRRKNLQLRCERLPGDQLNIQGRLPFQGRWIYSPTQNGLQLRVRCGCTKRIAPTSIRSQQCVGHRFEKSDQGPLLRFVVMNDAWRTRVTRVIVGIDGTRQDLTQETIQIGMRLDRITVKVHHLLQGLISSIMHIRSRQGNIDE